MLWQSNPSTLSLELLWDQDYFHHYCLVGNDVISCKNETQWPSMTFVYAKQLLLSIKAPDWINLANAIAWQWLPRKAILVCMLSLGRGAEQTPLLVGINTWEIWKDLYPTFLCLKDLCQGEISIVRPKSFSQQSNQKKKRWLPQQLHCWCWFLCFGQTPSRSWRCRSRPPLRWLLLFCQWE